MFLYVAGAVAVTLVAVVLLAVVLMGEGRGDGVHQPPVAKAYHVPEDASWKMQGSGKLTERSGVFTWVACDGRRSVNKK